MFKTEQFKLVRSPRINHAHVHTHTPQPPPSIVNLYKCTVLNLVSNRVSPIIRVTLPSSKIFYGTLPTVFTVSSRIGCNRRTCIACHNHHLRVI